MKLIKSLFVVWAVLTPVLAYAGPSSLQEACGCDVCPMQDCPCC